MTTQSTNSTASSTEPLFSTEFFNAAGIQYEEAFGHDTGLHNVLQRFISLLPPKSHVLDCGCGTGKPVAKTLADHNHQVHGIDLSSTMIELSRKQVPSGTFEVANMLEYTPPITHKFHGAVANLSLFELTREQLTLMSRNWFQWLEPGGYLFIGTMGADDQEHASSEMFDPDGQYAAEIPFMFMSRTVYMKLFTKEGWNKLLENAGFQIVHTETDLFRPPAAADCDDELHYFVIARKS